MPLQIDVRSPDVTLKKFVLLYSILFLLFGKDLVLKITVQPAFSKHLKIVKMRLLKTGACFIQLFDNVFVFFRELNTCLLKTVCFLK